MLLRIKKTMTFDNGAKFYEGAMIATNSIIIEENQNREKFFKISLDNVIYTFASTEISLLTENEEMIYNEFDQLRRSYAENVGELIDRVTENDMD